MRIAALQADDGPCGMYRIHNPMEYLRRAGHETQVYLTQNKNAMTPSYFAGCDALIVQRGIDPEIRTMIDCIPQDMRPVLIYEIDDLLWQLGPERLSYEDFRGRIRTLIMRTMRVCDAVIVSTPELADAVKPINFSVHVIPNAIDYDLRDWHTPYTPRLGVGNRTVIGWAGSIRPGGDMDCVGNAFQRLDAERDDWAFAIAGETDQCYDFARRLGLREGRVGVLQLAEFDEYPQLLSLFDIGIAPIEITAVNRCKSELKLIEYGAWGIPYVASRVNPYERYHKQTYGSCGYLAHDADCWYRQLTALLNFPHIRESMGRNAKSAVRSLYNAADRTEQYISVIQGVIDERRPIRRSPSVGNCDTPVRILG